APSLTIVDEKRVAHLKAFVENGGHLVLGSRTAVKNRDNAFHPLRPPAFLTPLTGAEVEDFYAINEDVPVIGNWFTGKARIWAERIRIIDHDFTLPVATYGSSNGWLDGQVAITVHNHQAGIVYYVGAYLDETAMFAFLKRVASSAGVNGMFEAPVGVHVYRRVRTYDRKEVFVIVNHTQAEQLVKLDNNTYDDHISGKRIAGQIRLSPYGVAVLTKTI
ncbi:beta-galactosidase trimerization domain-containing protein, partial [Anaerolinea sp.]